MNLYWEGCMKKLMSMILLLSSMTTFADCELAIDILQVEVKRHTKAIVEIDDIKREIKLMNHIQGLFDEDPELELFGNYTRDNIESNYKLVNNRLLMSVKKERYLLDKVNSTKDYLKNTCL